MLWEEQRHWTTPHQHSVFLYVYVCVYVCVCVRVRVRVRVRVMLALRLGMCVCVCVCVHNFGEGDRLYLCMSWRGGSYDWCAMPANPYRYRGQNL